MQLIKLIYLRTVGIVLTVIVPYFLFATGISADSTKRNSKINIGIEVGPNLTQEAIDYYKYGSPKKSAIRYSSGLFFQYHFNETSAIQTEIFYESKGLIGDIVLTDIMGNVTNKWKAHTIFDRITIPVLYRFGFNNFFINGGLYIGYAMREIYVSQKLTTTNTPPEEYKTIERLRKPLYKGVLIGFGYRFIDKKHFSLSAELRGDRELTNEHSFDETNRYRLNLFNLLLGIAYKL